MELIFQEKLLEVRAVLGREYLPYARLLPRSGRPEADWLTMELLPTLVLLPGCFGEVANPREVELAAALEISFLAGRVHDLTTVGGGLTRGILCGDYLYAAAGLLLLGAGYEAWLGRVGKVLCRRSEGKLMELGWSGRAYVPPEELVQALREQNAEGFALAAEMAISGCAADVNNGRDEERNAWSEFGYYVGILQAMQTRRLGTAFDREYDRAVRQAKEAAAVLPGAWGKAAEELILQRLERRRQAGVFAVGSGT